MLRTTSLNLSRNFIRNFNQHLVRIAEYQEQVSSGKKLNRPSDNPSDAVVALNIRSYRSKIEQYLRNIEDGQLRLNLAENALNDIEDVTVRARDIALMGVNSTVNDADRQGMAIEVNQLLEHLLTLANQKTTDGYLFGGTQTEAAPFDVVRNKSGEIESVAPHGDISGKLVRYVGPDNAVTVSADTENLLYGDQNLFQTLIDLRDALRSGDQDKINEALGSLNELHDRILGELSEIGSKSQYLQDRKNELDMESFEYLERLSDLEDADLTESLIFLQQEEIAYQAALAMGAEILRNSMVNFMK